MNSNSFAILQLPQTQAKLATQGLDAAASTSAQYQQVMRAEVVQ